MGVLAFLRPKVLLYGMIVLGFAVCAITLVGTVNRYTRLAATVTEYESEIERLHGAVTQYEVEIDRIERTLAVAEETQREAAAARASYLRMVEKIAKSKEADDGANAPVLRDTLDALRELRQ